MAAADAPPVVIQQPADRRATRFDLRESGSDRGKPYVPAIRSRCPEEPSGGIVVCATDPEQYRLRQIPGDFAQGTGKAEVTLGDRTRLGVHGASGHLAGGVTSPRLMVTATIGF